MADEILALIIMSIGLYLLLSNADAANNILNSLGTGYRNTVSALQGGI